MRTFEATNLVTYTSSAPLVSCAAASSSFITYSLSGTLPLGLNFLPPTGKIVGKIQELTSGTTATLTIQANNSLGGSNTLAFIIAYTVYPTINISQPVSGTTLTIDSTDEFTEASPLLTVLGRQIDGTTDNSVNCLTDTTRNKYTSSTLPEGFTLGICSGKLYGKYTGALTTASTTFPISITATNPTGSAVTLVSLQMNLSATFNISLTPDVPNNEYVAYNTVTYTSSSPLLSCTTDTTKFVNYRLSGTLPLGLTFIPSTGKIVGKIQELTSGTAAGLTIHATTSLGGSNTLAFSIAYTVYPAISITSPSASTNFSLLTTDEFTEASPLLTVLGRQIDGTTNNSVDCLNDDTRIKYTSSTLPEGFTLGVCSGKLYGKYTGTLLGNSSTFPVILNASNPTGETSTTISLTIGSSATPTITGLLDNSTKTILKGVTYTTDRPLLTLTGRNAPVSASAEDLPPGFSLSGFKVIGTAAPATAGSYEATFTITNSSATSAPVRVIFNIPINILEPLQGATYPAFAGQPSSQPYLINVVTSSLGQAHPITITTSSLPSGLTLQNNKIVGNPDNIGTYPITITAQSADYGKDSVTVVVTGTAEEYVVSGYVKTAQNVPIADVSVSYGGARTATTDTNGYYSLPVPNGTYTFTPTKSHHIISPASPGAADVTVNNGPVSNVNFTGEGPLRILSGKLTNSSTLFGVSNIAVGDGRGRTVSSNILGNYSLFTDLSQEITVTPTSPLHTFTPSYRTVPQGTGDVLSLNFDAVEIARIPAPVNMTIVLGNSRFTASFTQPAIPSPAVLSYYEYSLDDGANWRVSPNPVQTSPSMVITTLTDGTTPLTNGTTYNFRVRGVGGGAEGISSLPRSITTGTTPAAPAITSITPGSTQLTVNFTPADNGGYTISNYAYSLDGTSSYTPIAPADIASPLVITGLTNGNTYYVKIVAVNEKGNGRPSNIVTAKPAGAPGAPTINLPVLARDKSLIVDFSIASDGGSPLTELQYTLNADNASPTFYTVPASQTTSPVTITGLTNGTAYNVAIRAKNALSTGVISNIITGATPAIPAPAPSQPGAPVISATAGNQQITVTIDTPAAPNGSSITKYQYSFNGASWLERTDTGTVGSPITITKFSATALLVNGTTYNVRIRAVNAIGVGTVSNIVAVVPASIPSAPSNVVATPVNGKIAVQYTLSSALGVTISTYQYSLDGGQTFYNAGTTTNSFTITQVSAGPPVIPLTVGTTYSLVVRAITTTGISGAASVPVSVVLCNPPSVPTVRLPLTEGNSSVRFDYDAPISDGGRAIAKYQYALASLGEWTDATLLAPVNGGTGSIQITGLTNGNTYLLRLRAVNAGGLTGPATTAISFSPATVPGSPTITSITQPSSTSIRIAFTRPVDNGGRTVTGIKYSLDNGSTYSSSQPTLGDLIVTNLQQGATLTVKLKAANSVGDSVASSSQSITLEVIPDPYTAPTILSPLGVRNGGLDVIFTPPSNAPAGLGPDYQYSTDNGATWQPATVALGTVPGTLKIALNGLVNAQVYNILVRGVNAAGPGASSSLVRGSPATLPEAPTQVTTGAGDSFIAVFFTPPANGGSPITNYKYSLNNGPFVSADSALAPFTIKNVINGNSYYVRVLASNIIGDGPPSTTPQTPVMPGIPPSAPANFNVTSNSSAAAILSFTPGTAGSSAISSYEYSLNNGTTWLTSTATQSPITVSSSSLTQGNTYTFKVRAVSAVGPGTASASIIRKWGTLDAPTNVVGSTYSPTAIRIAFTPPSVIWQSPIINYQYSLNSGTIWTDSPATTSPITLTGITAGSTQNITVRAVNSVGAGAASAVFPLKVGLPGIPTVDLIEIYTDPNTTNGFNKRSTTIYFTPPAYDGGSPITGYEYSLNGGTTYVAIAATDTPLVISSTFPDNRATVAVDYAITIRAVNSAGKGPTSTKYVGPVMPPLSPSILSVIAKNNTIAISLNPPLLIGSESIASYEYKYCLSTEDIATAAWVSVPATSPITIPGLTPGSGYKLDVRAINSAGLASKPVTAGVYDTIVTSTILVLVFNNMAVVTTQGEADAPSITAGDIVVGSNKLTVPWTLYNSGGRELQRLEYSLNNGVTYVPADSLVSPLIIDKGLTYGTNYQLKLRMVSSQFNQSGTTLGYILYPGKDSIATSVTTSSDGPSSPVILNVDTSLDSAANPIGVVTFTPPTTGLDQVLGYQYSTDNGKTWDSATPLNPAATSISATKIKKQRLLKIRTLVNTGFGEESQTVLITVPDGRPTKPRLEFLRYSTDGVQSSCNSSYSVGGITQYPDPEDNTYRYTLKFLNTTENLLTPKSGISRYEIRASTDGVNYSQWETLPTPYGGNSPDTLGGDPIDCRSEFFLSADTDYSYSNGFIKRLPFPSFQSVRFDGTNDYTGLNYNRTFAVRFDWFGPLADMTHYTSNPIPTTGSYSIMIRACNDLGCSDPSDVLVIQ